ncbi:hypothetical protein LTS10_001357 [Elasticomyces elasticus]|nr:hypothetical protein LTS10_001357 [Elasticomyces elasticus]
MEATPTTYAFVERMFTVWASQGLGDAFLHYLSDDVIWTATGTSPLSGHYVGKRSYKENVLDRLHDKLDHSPRPEVERIIVQEDWATILFRTTGARGRNGTDFSMQYCWIVRVQDDKIREVVGFFDSKKMIDLFS